MSLLGFKYYDANTFFEEYKLGIATSKYGGSFMDRYRDAVLKRKEKIRVYDYELSDIMASQRREEDFNKRLCLAAELNNKGVLAEKNGNIDEAISLYEQNIADKAYFTLHPYHRLCVIYRKRKDFDGEFRVIQTALSHFKVSDKSKEKEFFSNRLEKVKQYRQTTCDK